MFVFFFYDTATTEIYTYLHTLSRHDALPIYEERRLDPERVEQLQDMPDAAPRPVFQLPIVVGVGTFAGTHRRAFAGLMLEGYDNRKADLLRPAFFHRSEEHTSELQSLMRISYAVFCLKKTKSNNNLMI